MPRIIEQTRAEILQSTDEFVIDSEVNGTRKVSFNTLKESLGGGGNGSSIEVDAALSASSENPVQNKVINSELGRVLASAKQYTDTKVSNKMDKVNLSIVAISGDYNDLDNLPTIPEVPELSAVATSGDYYDLDNLPTIPARPVRISELTNDAGYITSSSLPTKTSQLQNDSGFLTSLEGLDGVKITVCSQTEYDNLSSEEKRERLFIIKIPDLVLPEKGKALNDYTPAEIAMISEAGKASEYFNIGDEIEVMNKWNFTETFQIAGFDHDTISGTNKKAGITFILKDNGAGQGPGSGINSTDTNVGGWKDCQLRADYTRTLPLSDEWLSVVKTVDKYTNNVGYIAEATSEKNWQVADPYQYVTKTEDKFFILSYAEIYGNLFSGHDGSNIFTAEGSVYPIFELDNDLNREALVGKLASWLRSPDYNTTDKFMYIYHDFGPDSAEASYSPYIFNWYAFCV